MFFATFFSTVALGALIQKKTGQRIGLVEYLLMNSVAGITHALFGAQPLLVLRPTGPITAIIEKLSDLADTLDLDFWQYFAATGVCVGVLMGLTAAFEVSRLIKRVTPFVADVFACFVCSIYIDDGVTDIIKHFSSPTLSFGKALVEANLALLTFVVSFILFGAPKWRILPPFVRGLLQDYAVTLAVAVAAIVTAALSAAKKVDVERIPLAARFGPTCWWDGDGVATNQSASGAWSPTCANTTAIDHHDGVSPRPWIGWGSHSPPLDAGDLAKLWGVAFLSAIPITFFFYMDQNISSLLCQLKAMGLTRGRYFHASFLAMGTFCFVGPVFGLPFVTGSLPHSPQFVKALTKVTPPSGGGEGQRLSVAENRVAPLITYALLATPLFAPSLLHFIPDAANYGVLAYVGVEGILQTMLWKRTVLLFAPASEMPRALVNACGGSVRRIHLYTLCQLLALAVVWAVNLSPAGLCVSFVIVSLIPIRERLLPRLFDARALAAFDTEGILDEPEPPPLPTARVGTQADGIMWQGPAPPVEDFA